MYGLHGMYVYGCYAMQCYISGKGVWTKEEGGKEGYLNHHPPHKNITSGEEHFVDL